MSIWSHSDIVAILRMAATLYIHICFLCHPSVYHMIVKWKGFMKVSRRQVNICGRQLSCKNANMCFTICRAVAVEVGRGGVLLLNFVISKPMSELANYVRFTDYLRAIFKSLLPNICISTSASRFDDTYILRLRDNRLSLDT